ncbi:MAG TPA: phosphate regulon transcriptional regulator PhoB [Burkholderiales bacterium]|nr:phosphate regulon transcriptional regulator PhoB [Burkholderiales bacterium]
MQGHILVVDDDAAICELLAANLKDAGYGVACAPDATQAEARIAELRPDLALLDWMLPGTSGLMLARQLRADARTAGVSIIMLSARTEERDRIAALDGGVDDYLSKPFSLRELLARIRAVLRRRAPQLADEVVEIAGLSVDPAARRASAGGRDLQLWSTEFRILHYFMTHPGRILSRARLLDDIWGDHVFVEERTVDVHIRRLRQALAPSGHETQIETVRGVGYRFRTEAERAPHSTVTDLARFRGPSTPLPRARAA